MGQRAKWDLPDTPEPVSDRCFLVKVPDDPKHLAAFRGALYELTKPYAWGDDSEHTALVVGERWLANWLAIEEVDCDMLHQTLIEFDPNCGLQWSYDGGETWTTISLLACALEGGQQAIQDAIEDGLLQQAGGQPSPEEAPAPGECKTYHVVLRANERWKIPSPVNTGDTIAITNPKGGWADGAFQWYCYDGKAYVLGACTGDVPYEASDPIQSGNHMRIIGGYNTSTPVYFDCLAAAFVFPSGVDGEECWLQANDSPIDDNYGEVEFDVEICTGTWCYEFDFTVGQQGWTIPEFSGVPHAVYTSGSGFEHNAVPARARITIDLTFDTARLISIETIRTGSTANIGVWIQGTDTTDLGNTGYNAPLDSTIALDVTRGDLRIDVRGTGDAGTGTTVDGFLTTVRIRGTGENPFGSSNCE